MAVASASTFSLARRKWLSLYCRDPEFLSPIGKFENFAGTPSLINFPPPFSWQDKQAVLCIIWSCFPAYAQTWSCLSCASNIKCLSCLCQGLWWPQKAGLSRWEMLNTSLNACLLHLKSTLLGGDQVTDVAVEENPISLSWETLGLLLQDALGHPFAPWSAAWSVLQAGSEHSMILYIFSVASICSHTISKH